MIHIFEHKGVMLHVDYTPSTGDSGPTFNSVRVLDSNYRPTGPDLQTILNDGVLLGEPDAEGCAEAESFLSKIVGEIDGNQETEDPHCRGAA